MKIVAAIDPVTRIEGHMKVEVTIDTVNGVQQVVDAKSAGTLFRGFEKILIGRDPRDAQHITQRICGVCPVSHSMAAVIALEKAFGITPPENARILRNLVMGANFIDSHILHFYLLALPDYIRGPAMAPWRPAWLVDMRFRSSTTNRLLSHYERALGVRRKAHEMGALFGGRMPHPPTFLPGGVTAAATSARLKQFKTYLAEISSFVEDFYIPDAQTLASKYSDYCELGRGRGNLLAYGCFDLNSTGSKKLFKRGFVSNASSNVRGIISTRITEDISKSWYESGTSRLRPAEGKTLPQYPKTGAYSWLKAPRYQGIAYEVGALARMWINGEYRQGISVMDRHVARALEAQKIARAMAEWLSTVVPDQAVYRPNRVPDTAEAVGLTEAPRGALGHWLRIAGKKIAHYQIITPTCWNCSPCDDRGMKGPLEAALIGIPVQDSSKPLEVLRVVHSFDPCLDCAVHVCRPKKGFEPDPIFHPEFDEHVEECELL